MILGKNPPPRPKPALPSPQDGPPNRRTASQRVPQILGRRDKRHRQQAILARHDAQAGDRGEAKGKGHGAESREQGLATALLHRRSHARRKTCPHQRRRGGTQRATRGQFHTRTQQRTRSIKAATNWTRLDFLIDCGHSFSGGARARVSGNKHLNGVLYMCVWANIHFWPKIGKRSGAVCALVWRGGLYIIPFLPTPHGGACSFTAFGVFMLFCFSVELGDI